MNNPYDQYRQTSIETANPAKLLIMLFDGALMNLSHAIDAIDSKDIENANLYLQKTQDIIQELIISLDMNIEISHYLYELYDYFYRRLLEANLKKDKAIAEEVLQFIREFREVWAQAAVISNSEVRTGTGINIEG